MNGLIKAALGVVGLIGLCTHAVAAPMTVHYSEYAVDGSLLTSGIVGAPDGSGVNTGALVAPNHGMGRYINFWVDSHANPNQISWNFDWALAYSSSFTAQTSQQVTFTSTASLSIGTAMTWGQGMSGMVTSDMIGISLPQSVNLDSYNQYSYSTGAASLAANQSTGSYVWDQGVASSVWVYIDGNQYYSAERDVTASFEYYGNVSAEAFMTMAEPVDALLPLGEASSAHAVPEPASVALLLLGLALVARTQSRIVPAPVRY